MLLQALIALPLIRLGLGLFGLARTQRMLAWRLHSPVGDAICAQSAAQMVSIGARVIPANCLQRSLALWWLLHQRGFASDLRIGVRRHGDKLAAHAWIEHAGEVLNDRPDIARLYAPFSEPISRATVQFE